MSTVAHPGHPMGPSIPADSSLTPLSWEGDKMFNIYIYDYCSKRGFKRTAKELLAEAEIPSESTPPINARQGLLFEWWSVFWVLFTAKANGHGPDDAMIYTQHQANQAANRQRQPPPQPGQPILQNGGQIPIGGQMRPPGLMNGLPVPGGPRNYIPNGVGPAPGFGNPQINGAPTPGPGPGYQNLMPGQRPPQRNGNIGPGPPFENHNPNSNSMPNSSQNPNNPNQNQPGPGPGPGQSPHMRAMGMGGMIPPGQNNQPGAGGYQQLGRPPSRTATPGAMMTQQSPRPTPMIDPQNLNAEITKIPQQVLGQLKQELGLESKDLPSLTMDDKQRILQTFRNRQQRTKLPGQPNAAAGPSNMMAGQQQPQQRNTRPSKRNSTSPGDEDMNQGNGSSPPATKRIRRSPLEQPPMTPMAAGYPQMPPQQPMMGIPRGPPPNGFSIPQGMQMVNPMSVQMGNNMTMAGMSPGMSNNPGGMMTPQMQMQNLQNNPQHYRQAMVMHNNQRGPPMGPGPMNGQNGPMGSMASPPSDAQFNPGFNPGRQQPQPGQKPMGMLPPPSPQGMSMSKDQQNQNQNNSNKEGNKEDGSATGTPTATGTAPPTPAPNMAQSPLGLGASGMNSAPSLGMGSGMGNAGSGMGAVSGMGNSGMGSDLFSHDFINSVADQLDFDPSMFKPDGDINFERDFGQWFSPDDVPAQ